MDPGTATVFITGGTSGIGLETARVLLQRGAKVAVFDIAPNPDAVKSLENWGGGRAKVFKADVTRFDSVSKAFKQAVRGMGRPDLVLNSAGTGGAVEFLKTTSERWERVIHLNLNGSRYVALAAIPILKQGGRLALMASLAGLVGSYGYSAYAASKFAVVGLAQVLRMELKPMGLEVSVICPPEVETPMVARDRASRPKAAADLKLFAGHLSVQTAVSEIVAGLERGEFLIIPGRRARLTFALVRFAPMWFRHWMSDRIVKKAMSGVGI